MTPPVKLMDLTEALEMTSEESRAWLDRQTGQVVVVDNDVRSAVESAEVGATPDGLEDWQREQVPAAQAISAGDARYLALPDRYEFHEYRHLEKFIGTVADAGKADQLWRASKGKGAFRHFKDTAARLGLLDDWYRYRDKALNRFMLDWAEVSGVTVDQSPHNPGKL